MRIMLISLIVVACIGVNAGQTKEQKLNKQIAVLESQNFALKNENKKLKAELEKKNKAIQSLAMKLAGQPKQGNSHNNVNNSSRSRGYDPAEAQRKAIELQKKQQEEQKARQLAVIDQKIKYYEKQKKELEEEYEAAGKKIHSAKYMLGRAKRKKATQEAEEDQKKIKSKMSNIDYNLDSLKRQRLNYL